MTPLKKIKYCLYGNITSLFIVMVLIIVFRDKDSNYFKFGPDEDLILISVKIDTWLKWTLTLIIIALIRSCEMIIHEIGHPVLVFNIYNPDKTNINDFTKNQLYILANAIYLLSGIRGMLMTVLSITQIDLALCSVLVSWFVGVFTSRFLLNEKTYIIDSCVLEDNSNSNLTANNLNTFTRLVDDEEELTVVEKDKEK